MQEVVSAPPPKLGMAGQILSCNGGNPDLIFMPNIELLK